MHSDIIKQLIDHVTTECNAVDTEARYDEMIDDCYSFKDVGGPFKYLRPSLVLAECLPTDYRCGLADYTGTDDDMYEIGDKYYDCREVEKERDNFADEIGYKITDLEKELEELEQQHLDATDADTLDSLQDEIIDAKEKLKELQEQLDEVKSYVF